jgi:hypothetical protein
LGKEERDQRISRIRADPRSNSFWLRPEATLINRDPQDSAGASAVPFFLQSSEKSDSATGESRSLASAVARW